MCDCECYQRGYEDGADEAPKPAIELERGEIDALADLAQWLLEQDLFVQWDVMGGSDRVDALKRSLRTMQRVVPADGFNIKKRW